MATVHFFIDNLSMGGFQRLCLDQAYYFANEGYEVEIHSLTQMPAKTSSSFINLESSQIAESTLKISTISPNHFFQLINTLKILKRLNRDDLVISHSLRATAVLWIARLIARSSNPFLTSIHQLPSLSAPFQRTKRFLYAQLSPILTAYSQAVKDDWDSRLSKGILRKIFLRKEIVVLRNGIFLNRLPFRQEESAPEQSKRLIFLGRNTGWKGVSTLLEFVEMPPLQDFKILIMMPEIDKSWEEELRARFDGRIELVIGKTLSSYKPIYGDVHFYAAQYGSEAKFVEAISLNCLEMASLGVPSLVTKGGVGTWPELVKTGIFVECDWGALDDTCRKVVVASEMTFSPQTIQAIRNLVDVRNNVSRLVESLVHIS
jgi:glycosyltransferase involved in cell wall biosynthesis